MWRNGNLLALLVGMQTGAAAVLASAAHIQTGAAALENSVEIPQKIKNRTTLQPSNNTTRNLSKDTGVLIHRGTCTPMFIAALSTMAKSWSLNVHQLTNG